MRQQLLTPFEFKSVDEGGTGRFSGIANHYNIKDAGGDVVLPGCFAKSLAKHGGKVPILQSHRSDMQVGWGISAEETKRGLEVEGEFTTDSLYGQSAYAICKHAMKLGQQARLSIGYGVNPGGAEERSGTRYLKDCELYEYSIVPLAMNSRSYIEAIKEMPNVSGLVRQVDSSDARTAFEGFLRSVLQMSRKDAHQVLWDILLNDPELRRNTEPPAHSGPVAVAKAFAIAEQKRRERHDWLEEVLDPPRPPKHPWIPVSHPDSGQVIRDKCREDNVALVESAIAGCKSADEVEALLYRLGFTEAGVTEIKTKGWMEP